MDKRLESYDYSRKILFMETQEKKFKESIGDSIGKDIVMDRAKILNSINRRVLNGETYDLLQDDDTILGWMSLENSPQIYRFAPRQCKIYDEKYFDTSINETLGKNRNYKLLFKDKIVVSKCVVTFEEEKYFGIFINNNFHGFHHESYVDFLIDTDINLETNLKDIPLFKISNLTQKVDNYKNNNETFLVGVFPQHKIGKIKIKNTKSPIWINLDDVNETIKFVKPEYSKEEMVLDDIFEFIKVERNKSKLIVDQVLKVKEYIKEKSK